MARVKGGLGAKKRHNRTLKLAKGYRGARAKQYRVAKQSVMRALTSSYAGRKERKRQFRQLWIARINAAARMNGLSYSQFMHGLKVAGADLNRKVLADMAVTDAAGFAKLAEVAKKALAQSSEKCWVENSGQVVCPEFFEKYTGKGIGNNGKKRTARKQTWVYYALGRMCNRMRKCMEVSLDVRTKRRWQFHACLCDLSAHFRASGNGDGTFRRTCGTDKSLVYV